MAYDKNLAARCEEYLYPLIPFASKKMFGGVVFMVHGHMLCGVVKDKMMARVGPFYEQALAFEHVTEMDFTKKPLKGFIYVESLGLEEEGLGFWIDKALEFVLSLPPKA